MTWFSRKSDLSAELADAQREGRQARERGRRREPMIERLEEQAQANGFVDRLIAALEQTRRGHA